MKNNSHLPNVLKRTLMYFAVVWVTALTAWAEPVTFAQFVQPEFNNDFVWTNMSANVAESTLNAQTSVLFRYSNLLGLPPELQGDHEAVLTLSAITSSLAAAVGDIVIQPVDAGSFEINLVNPIFGQTLLLGGIFQSGYLTGQGGSGSVSFSTPLLTNVVFSSAFLDFSGTLNRAFAFSFSSLAPPMSLGDNGRAADFTAAGTGTFSLENPSDDPVVPEPMSVVLMGTGLLLVGVLKRRSLR